MWARWLGMGAGAYLMAAPGLIGFGGPLRVAHLVIGPLAFAVALIARAEVAQSLRWASLPLGLVLMNMPWLAGGGPPLAVGSCLGAGLLLIILARMRGPRTERFGGGWRGLFGGE